MHGSSLVLPSPLTDSSSRLDTPHMGLGAWFGEHACARCSLASGRGACGWHREGGGSCGAWATLTGVRLSISARGRGQGPCILPCSLASPRAGLLGDAEAPCDCECVSVCACMMIEDYRVPGQRVLEGFCVPRGLAVGPQFGLLVCGRVYMHAGSLVGLDVSRWCWDTNRRRALMPSPPS